MDKDYEYYDPGDDRKFIPTKVTVGGIPRYVPSKDELILPDRTYDGWSTGMASAHEIGHWRDSKLPGAVHLTTKSTGKEHLQDELNAWIHQVSRRGVTEEDKEYLAILRQEAVDNDLTESEFTRMLVKAWRRYELKGR